MCLPIANQLPDRIGYSSIQEPSSGLFNIKLNRQNGAGQEAHKENEPQSFPYDNLCFEYWILSHLPELSDRIYDHLCWNINLRRLV